MKSYLLPLMAIMILSIVACSDDEGGDNGGDTSKVDKSAKMKSKCFEQDKNLGMYSASCELEDACYFPLEVGSKWTYAEAYGDPWPITRTMQEDTVIQGETYVHFGITHKRKYYRYEDGIVYYYKSAKTSTPSSWIKSIEDVFSGELRLFLNQDKGFTWKDSSNVVRTESSIYGSSTEYTNNFVINSEIIGRDLTKEVNGNTFYNVIGIKSDETMDGSLYASEDNETVSSVSYYAPGVGLISYEGASNVYLPSDSIYIDCFNLK